MYITILINFIFYNDKFYFSVFEVLDNDTIVELSREIQNGKVILCDDINEMENNIPTSKICKLRQLKKIIIIFYSCDNCGF